MWTHPFFTLLITKVQCVASLFQGQNAKNKYNKLRRLCKQKQLAIINTRATVVVNKLVRHHFFDCHGTTLQIIETAS